MMISLHRSAVVIASLAISSVTATPARAQEEPRPSTDSRSTSQAEDACQNDTDEADCDRQSSKKSHEPNEKPDRVFGVLPNYTSVDPFTTAPRITTSQAYKMAAMNSFDPYVFPFVGIVAALGAGQGDISYVRRYPTALADNTIGNFLTTAIIPSLLHQDPRYFELGTGSFWHRFAYAGSRVIVTRSPDGSAVFNFSEIGGNLAAATISNTYYPSADRSSVNTVTRWATQVAWDAVSNELKEFWPDLRRKIHH